MARQKLDLGKLRGTLRTTTPEEYAHRVVEVVDQHQRFNREEHFTTARKAGTPEQAKALGRQRRRT